MTRTWIGSRTALGVSALAIAALAFAPAAVGHAAPTKPTKKAVSFGAKLTKQSEPANFNASKCASKGPCTRLMTEAYHRADSFVAPKNGTIGKIELVGIEPGSFKLQIAKVKGSGDATKAKILRASPTINYNGQASGEDDGPPFTIESFKVNLRVEKGDLLAVKGKKISFAYCSGGSGVLEFQPALAAGGKYAATTGQEDCLLLLEAIYK